MSGYALDPDEKIRPAAVQPGHDGEPYEPLAIRAPPSVEQMQIDTEANVELPRSKFQMFAILSALFVRLFPRVINMLSIMPPTHGPLSNSSPYFWPHSIRLSYRPPYPPLHPTFTRRPGTPG